MTTPLPSPTASARIPGSSPVRGGMFIAPTPNNRPSPVRGDMFIAPTSATYPSPARGDMFIAQASGGFTSPVGAACSCVDVSSHDMPPLRGWTTVLLWFYKHATPTGLACRYGTAFYKHGVPMGLGLVVAALFLFSALLARADDLIVSNQTPAFILDTRLPSTDPGPGSLIVQFESPPFTLDTRLPDGVAPSSGTVVTESGSFILDTRLPDGVAPSSGTVVVESSRFTLDTRLPDGISFTNGVVIVASPPFTLDTRLPADTTPPAAMVVTAESPLFTLDTRLPGDTTPLPNLITQAETPTFTLDTRIALQDPLNTNLLGMAQSDPFTLDTLSGAYTTPAQTLSGGTTGGRARFSPDGLQLAKADGSRVLLWNLHSIRTNVTFTGHAGDVTTVEFSPLGDQLLTGSADGTFRWWDTASRIELGHTNPPGNGTVYAAYASDGARILAGRGANAALYRVPSIQLMQQFPGSEGTLSAVAVCPEGLALAGNSYRSATLWDTATGVVRSHLTNHTRMITAAAFLPGGTNAMTASLDGTIRIWDTATGTERLRIQAGTQVGDAALSLDGRLIASCDTGNPGTASLWDAQSGALLRIFTDTGSEASQIKCVALSPDQTALATTHVDGSVRLWNTGLDPRPIYPVTPLPIGTNALVTLRSHGLYYFAVDAQAARSLVFTLEADTSGGSAKLKGSAYIPVGSGRALSTDAEFANLGVTQADKNVGAPTSKSLQSPPPGADIAAIRMTASTGYLPSVYDYESFAQAALTNLHCDIPLVTPANGKLYVLVFSPYLSAGAINARVRADYADFHLSSISPSKGGTAGSVTAQVRGTGFGSNTVVVLSGGGGVVITGVPVYDPDPTEMVVRFDLRSAAPGKYNVIAQSAKGLASLSGGFEIVAGGQGEPSIQWSGPSAIRFGRSGTFTATVENRGFTDLQNVAVLFYLVAVNPANQLPAEGLPTYFLYKSYVAPREQVSMSTVISGTLFAQCYKLGAEKIDLTPHDTDDCNKLADRIRGVLQVIERYKLLIRHYAAQMAEIERHKNEVCPQKKDPATCINADEISIAWHRKQIAELTAELAAIEAIKDDLCAAMSNCSNKPQECAAGSAPVASTVLILTPTDSACEPCGDAKLQLGSAILLPTTNWPVLSAGKASQKSDALGDDFCVVRPIDPNDKIGPNGVGPNRVVSTIDFMDYTVRFENMAAATAPVQELVIVDYLDPNLDWTTVEFEEIAYGDRLLQPPAGSQSFTLRDVPPANSTAITGSGLTNLAVKISGMFNPQVGRVEWRVACVDTNTGTWPMDALAGILPPEDGTGRGQGHVRFRVKPKAATPFGTTITNIATIVFDGNDPIATPAVWNTVGDVPSLAATITYPPDQVMTGKPFTSTVVLTNAGSATVTNVVLTYVLPPGLNILSATATFGSVTVTNGTLVWNLGTFTGGAGATLTIIASAAQSGTFANNFYYSGGSGLAIFTSPGVITVLPSVPTLGIRMNNGQVELYWQTNFTGFHVQRTSSLSTSNRWVDVTNAPVIVGQEYRVTNGPPVGTQFYRLSGTLASSVAQPVIGIQVVGTEIQLSWPTNASAFHLQSAASIAPAAWSDVTNVPAALGGFYRVNVNATGASSYFRLLKP